MKWEGHWRHICIFFFFNCPISSGQRVSSSQTHHTQTVSRVSKHNKCHISKEMHTLEYRQEHAYSKSTAVYRQSESKWWKSAENIRQWSLGRDKAGWNINANKILTSFFYWTLKFCDYSVFAAACLALFNSQRAMRRLSSGQSSFSYKRPLSNLIMLLMKHTVPWVAGSDREAVFHQCAV